MLSRTVPLTPTHFLLNVIYSLLTTAIYNSDIWKIGGIFVTVNPIPPSGQSCVPNTLKDIANKSASKETDNDASPTLQVTAAAV